MTETSPSDHALKTVDPLSGETVVEMEPSSAEQVRQAIGRAREAASAWAARSLGDRAAILKRVGKEFGRRAPELVDALVRENGKPAAEAWSAEILADLDLFSFHTRRSPKLLAPERVRLDPLSYPGKRGELRYEPRGTILLISPWNFPVAIPLRTLLPALLAGNTVVWKPSEYSLLSSRILGEVFHSELPEGVLEQVVGAGETGRMLTAEPWGRVVFTGSVATGRAVGRACAETLTPVSLELGGKDAAIVLADADLERTANGLLWGAMTNAGQNCAAVERVYVESSVAADLRQRLQDKARALRTRSPSGAEGEVGPLTVGMQRDKVMDQLSQSLSMGARLLQGGNPGPGLLLEPTLVEGAPDDSPVMVDETFGPVLPLREVGSADEAVKLANASRFGLTTSIWTRNFRRARDLAQRLESGIVTVNNHAFTAAIAQAPWTGTKDTGSGITNSKHALYEMVRPVFYLEDRNRARRELWWYPYDENLLGVLQGMWRLRTGGLANRWKGLRALIRHFPRRLRTK